MVEQFDLRKYLDTLTKALETGKHKETSYYARHRRDFRNTFIETHVENFLGILSSIEEMHGYFDIDENLQDPLSDRKALEQVEKFFSNLKRVRGISAEEISQLMRREGLLDNERDCRFKDREQIWKELVQVINELKRNGHRHISYLNEAGELSEYVKDVFDIVCHYSSCSYTDLLIIKSVEMFDTFRSVCFPRGYTEQQRYSEVFGEWLFATDLDQKRHEAARIFGTLISNLRSRAIREERIKLWTESLSTFEELIIFVKSRIEKNGFYRDHLNHVIRVCLLLMMLLHRMSQELREEGGLTKQDMEAGVISALFHDICYPVEQSVHIFKNTSEALSDCYTVYGIKRILWDYEVVLEHKNFLKKIESDLSDIIEENVKKAQSNWRESISHAILGSTQYLDLQRETRRTENPITINALRSILLHDSKLVKNNLQVSFVEKPIPCLLILSDELQEWGRPVVDIEEIPIREVDLSVEKKEDILVIGATFDHTNFSRKRNGLTNRLRPVASKFGSLGRIIFDGNVHIAIRFILSKRPNFYTRLSNMTEVKYKLQGSTESLLLNSSDIVFFSRDSEEVIVVRNTKDLDDITEVTIQSVVNPSSTDENLVATIERGDTSIRFKEVNPIFPDDESVDIFSKSRADGYECSMLVVFDKREGTSRDSAQEVRL